MTAVSPAGIAVTFMTSIDGECNAQLAVSGSPSETLWVTAWLSHHFPEGWRSRSTPGRIAGSQDSMNIAEGFPRTCTH